MPDVSLPPVGELVQITWAYPDGVTNQWLGRLAELSGEAVFVEWPSGHLSDLAEHRIVSWCRVLVIPDTEETVELVTAAAWDSDAERVRIDAPWSELDDAVRVHWLRDIRAGLAAVRGAAIR
jgi:hypothetical protein